MIFVGDIDLQQQRHRVELLDHPSSQTHGTAEVGDHHRCSFSLRDLGDVKANGGVEGDAGNKDVLALENAHGWSLSANAALETFWLCRSVAHAKAAVDGDHCA